MNSRVSRVQCRGFFKRIPVLSYSLKKKAPLGLLLVLDYFTREYPGYTGISNINWEEIP